MEQGTSNSVFVIQAQEQDSFAMLSDCCCYRSILFGTVEVSGRMLFVFFYGVRRGLGDVGYDKLGQGVSFRWQV